MNVSKNLLTLGAVGCIAGADYVTGAPRGGGGEPESYRNEFHVGIGYARQDFSDFDYELDTFAVVLGIEHLFDRAQYGGGPWNEADFLDHRLDRFSFDLAIGSQELTPAIDALLIDLNSEVIFPIPKTPLHMILGVNGGLVDFDSDAADDGSRLGGEIGLMGYVTDTLLFGGRGGIRDLGEGLLDGTEAQFLLFGKTVLVLDGGSAFNIEAAAGFEDLQGDAFADSTTILAEGAVDFYPMQRWSIGGTLGYAANDDLEDDDLTFGARSKYFFNRLAGGFEVAAAFTPGDEDGEEDVIAASAGLFWRW